MKREEADIAQGEYPDAAAVTKSDSPGLDAMSRILGKSEAALISKRSLRDSKLNNYTIGAASNSKQRAAKQHQEEGFTLTFALAVPKSICCSFLGSKSRQQTSALQNTVKGRMEGREAEVTEERRRSLRRKKKERRIEELKNKEHRQHENGRMKAARFAESHLWSPMPNTTLGKQITSKKRIKRKMRSQG